MSKTPEQIVKQIMLENDAFSQLLGMQVVAVAEGACTVSLEVTKAMTNGFGIAHGGITYSLSDSAFAFACNSLGYMAVSVETSISHMQKVSVGDQLSAKATMVQRSRSLGRFVVQVHNQTGELVSDFKGTCYFTDKKYE